MLIAVMSNVSFCSTAPQIDCYAETSAASLAACWAAAGTPSYVFGCAEGNKILCAGSNVTAIGASLNSSRLPVRCITTATSSGYRMAHTGGTGALMVLLVAALSAFGLVTIM